jgi:alanine racemase
MPRPIAALIHPDAIAHNLRQARRQAPDARLWAVIKANAYGHGIERVWSGVLGADGMALLDLAEASGCARWAGAARCCCWRGCSSPATWSSARA